MKWKTLAAIAAGIACLAGAPAPGAMAGGVGFYLSGGGGNADTRAETPGGRIKEDERTSHAGLGFVFDTNLLQERRVFNYRMHVGYERMDFKVDEDFPADPGHRIELDGGVLSQDFGFGGNVARNVRLWGGPSLRLSYHHGGDQFGNEFKFAGIGIGPVIGLNVGTGGPVAFSFRAGYSANGYVGKWVRPSGLKDDYSAGENYFYLTFATLFGVGE